MLLRTITFPLLIAIAFSAGADDKDAAKAGFWTWFKSQKSGFAEVFRYESGAQNDATRQEKIETAVENVGAKLREVHPEFSPYFGSSEGAHEMIVTVDGQAEYFKAVETFIASAPEIEGWKFIALKQPLSASANMEIQSGSAKLKIGNCRYAMTKNSKGALDFTIYISNKVSDDPEGFNRLLTQLTMDFLGERFTSTAMGKVTVRELTDHLPAGLLPFVDIYKDVSRQKIRG